MRHDDTVIETTGPVGTDLEVMLTPEEVADLLKVSKSTLCRLTKRGEIPHKRLGDRVVRYLRSEIAAWQRSNS